MKLHHRFVAFISSKLYAASLRKKEASCLDLERFQALVKAVERHRYSPLRKRLVSHLVAAYYVAPGDTVIDAGANVGRYTHYYASFVGQTGKVHAYEAHPRIFKRLQNQFREVGQVVLHPLAVSNRSEGSIKMQIYPEDQECSTVETAFMETGGNVAMILVPCRKLDAHIEEVGKCSFIKIDVEGHEHAVIDGAAGYIQKHRPVVMYEYGYELGKVNPGTIAQMEKLGYFSYDCRTLTMVAPNYLSPVATDLIAVPAEKREEFEGLAQVIRSTWPFLNHDQ